MLGARRAIYKKAIRPCLFRFDEEAAHRLTLRALPFIPPVSFRPDDALLQIELWNGIKFSNPIGLAAGADKNAQAVRWWKRIGFGFQEIGTITPLPQEGNNRPRIQRHSKGLVNRMGFPSDGADLVAPRLEFQRPCAHMPVALNFGPNKSTPPDRVAEDYAVLTRKLGRLADFIVVNLSSPNTPGLREWQAPERMRTIVEAVRSASNETDSRIPLLIKIAPDLEFAQLREVCGTIQQLKVDGIIATNTTIQRERSDVKTQLLKDCIEGGVSGRPLKSIALQTVEEIYKATAGTIPIIGVGGIFSSKDAFEFICAGASLLELYTGLVFEGDTLVEYIKQGLVKLLQEHGFSSIQDAVGSGVAVDRFPAEQSRVAQVA
jgi:dihydroorotate dehydrogenase